MSEVLEVAASAQTRNKVSKWSQLFICFFLLLLGGCQWVMWAVLHNSPWISTVGYSPIPKPPVRLAPAP